MDLYASRHLNNNKELFVEDLKAKSLDFTTVDGQTLWLKSISMVTIPFINKIIRLENVAYIPDYNINLISLKQPHKNNITFIDNKNNRVLMQGQWEIA